MHLPLDASPVVLVVLPLLTEGDVESGIAAVVGRLADRRIGRNQLRNAAAAGDAQRIGGNEVARTGDGRAEKIAVGRERGEHSETALDVDGSDSAQIAPPHSAGDEV